MYIYIYIDTILIQVRSPATMLTDDDHSYTRLKLHEPNSSYDAKNEARMRRTKLWCEERS